MKRKLSYLPMIIGLLFFNSCNNNEQETAETAEKSTTESTKTEQRIISLNGAVSEIIFALNQGKNVVGRDATSVYPESITDTIEDLGHVRTLNIESIAALKPTLILGTDFELSTEMKSAIQNLGVNNNFFMQDFTVEGTKTLIQEVANYLEAPNAQELIDKIETDMQDISDFQEKPKVLFIYARGAGTVMVAGEDTPMEQIIELAGGQNAVKGFQSFKPLTEEALLESNPDIILLFETGLQSLGGENGLPTNISGFSKTNAGKNNAVIAMDGAFLVNFGPRVGEAAHELNKRFQQYAE